MQIYYRGAIKLNILIIGLFIGLLAYWLIGLFFAPSARAQAEVASPNYIIQMPNFNGGAGIPSDGTYNISSTIGQTAAGLYSSSGYRVKSGFQYIYSIIPFSFTVSSLSINMGHLVSQSPVT